MDEIQQLSEAARKLTPEQLSARLAEINQEARVIRALLRAALDGRDTVACSPRRTGGGAQ